MVRDLLSSGKSSINFSMYSHRDNLDPGMTTVQFATLNLKASEAYALWPTAFNLRPSLSVGAASYDFLITRYDGGGYVEK